MTNFVSANDDVLDGPGELPLAERFPEFKRLIAGDTDRSTEFVDWLRLLSSLIGHRVQSGVISVAMAWVWCTTSIACTDQMALLELAADVVVRGDRPDYVPTGDELRAAAAMLLNEIDAELDRINADLAPC